MFSTIDYALIPLAGVGAFAILSKAQDAYHYFLREVASSPSEIERPWCFGEYRDGAKADKRGCADCAFLGFCTVKTDSNRLYHTGGIPTINVTDNISPRMKAITEAMDRSLRREQSTVKIDVNGTDFIYAPPHGCRAIWIDDKCVWRADDADAKVYDSTGYGRAIDQGEPLKQTPPNMGGLDSNVPYQGGNYVDDTEFAESLKPVPHYGFDPEMLKRNMTETPQFESSPSDPTYYRKNFPDDLAWDFKEQGTVAGDGGIWLSTQERAYQGSVLVQRTEIEKAQRFGWRTKIFQVSDKTRYVTMER